MGLPLAVAFSEIKNVVGFDINKSRIRDLSNQYDKTNEIENWEFLKYSTIFFTNDINETRGAKYFVITVPTPVNEKKEPDLQPLIKACELVGSVIEKNSFVIFESTVYPGTTEEVCVPILENTSGLELNKDFYVGYSPERINPGDKKHKLKDITKVVSGSTPKALDEIAKLYEKIIQAGVFKASSIKVAEAAKVIENTQRDLNIALVNELSKIFNLMDIDTLEVLDTADTKWNFQKFTPGLVGGHCIGVDPYYLTYKAQSLGYEPEVILSGRRINDEMGKYVVEKFLQELTRKNMKTKEINCLVLGLTFKENCPDLRNTGSINVIRELENNGINPLVLDPWADPDEAKELYDLELISLDDLKNQDIDHAIITVAHHEFLDFAQDLRKTIDRGLIFDIKSFLPKEYVDLRL